MLNLINCGMVLLKLIQMRIKIEGLQKAQKKLTWPGHRCFSGWSSAGGLWQMPGLGSSCPIPEQGNSWWLQRAPSLHRLSRWKPHPLHCYSDKPPLVQVDLKYVPHAKTPLNRPGSDIVKQKTPSMPVRKGLSPVYTVYFYNRL